MKRFFAIGLIGIAALLFIPVVPAFACELSIGEAPAHFQALSGLPDARRIELAAMTNEELAAIEGTAFFCTVCINAARIRQVNVSTFSFNTLQSNVAVVRQRN
jgi:hypothetical protein